MVSSLYHLRVRFPVIVGVWARTLSDSRETPPHPCNRTAALSQPAPPTRGWAMGHSFWLTWPCPGWLYLSVFLGGADLRVCHWGRMTLGSRLSEAAPSNWAKASCFFAAIWPGLHAGHFTFFLSPVRSLLREIQGVVFLMQSISLPKFQPCSSWAGLKWIPLLPAAQDWRWQSLCPWWQDWKGSKQDAGCIQSPAGLGCHTCSWVSAGWSQPPLGKPRPLPQRQEDRAVNSCN